MRSFLRSQYLPYMKLFVPYQIEYEDPMNATFYEEYEIDEDNFDSARRERPETWKREVSSNELCVSDVCKNPYTFISFCTSDGPWWGERPERRASYY